MKIASKGDICKRNELTRINTNLCLWMHTILGRCKIMIFYANGYNNNKKRLNAAKWMPEPPNFIYLCIFRAKIH